MFERMWVWITALYTRWTWYFSHWFVVKIVLFHWKRSHTDEKEAGVGPFLKVVKNENVKNEILTRLFKIFQNYLDNSQWMACRCLEPSHIFLSFTLVYFGKTNYERCRYKRIIEIFYLGIQFVVRFGIVMSYI